MRVPSAMVITASKADIWAKVRRPARRTPISADT
jgi:hypothetical protein